MFKGICVGGPVQGWVEQSLKSLIAQHEQDWQAQVVLDPCGDKSYEHACSVKDSRISVRLNEVRQYGLKNTADAVQLLEPDDEDILFTLDCDDWLKPEALTVVRRAYEENPELVLTYGSWEPYPDPTALTNTYWQYEPNDFNDIRHKSFRASHLRTFKYKLWKRIDQKRSFLDPRGQYFRAATDLAFMFPMLEMAGYHRVKWIKDRIYVHNQARTHGDAEQFGWEQTRNSDHIPSLVPYAMLNTI